MYSRQQYEGVVGFDRLADLRPSRLKPSESDLLGLLGAMPAVGLGDSADSCGTTTRYWVAEAVGMYATTYPRIIPEVFDYTQGPDRQTSEDARRALRYAVGLLDDDTGASSGDSHTAPAVAKHVYDHRSLITGWLHDECQSTTATALILLSGIAPWYCETATNAIPVATANLDDNDAHTSAMALIRSVALCNDKRRATLGNN